MSRFNKLTVQEIRRETPNAVSIVLDVPAALQQEYRFVAGQYLTISHEHNGKEIRRAYSICSTPESGEVRIVVKKVEQGLFSKYANETLKVGDQLAVDVPEGRFTFTPNVEASNNYAAFAAGSGITPVMSILQTVLTEEPNSTFVLVYGNKTAEETIFHTQLHLLQEQYPERFYVHFVYSRMKENDALFGRIDKAAINFVVNNTHQDKHFATYFLCGPEAMIDVVRETIQAEGIAQENILFEIFTPNTDANDPVETQGGTTKVTVIVDDEESSFEMPKNQALLHGVLEAGIDAPYSCQGGICSSCMCRVTKGSATMKRNSILTEDEVEEGLILSCQAIVTSDEIHINYDDI
ncbi:2Fe-2S iron-sulfur cluster-binding protein [Myroides sp. DW712]|uniref:2Fe-2S iron-sulfur cluster-binding protein n=1 Tax=Myroides sp. DW712 TaxID=3389800 RepID=UPI00397AE46A